MPWNCASINCNNNWGIFHMRSALPVLAIFALAACETTMPPADTSAGLTPVPYKANTPRVTRGFDINECELAARGLSPSADAEQIAASSTGSNVDQQAAFVRECLANKGYEILRLPVCTDTEKRRGTIVSAPDIMPPKQSIRCADPVNRTLVVA